MEQQTSNPEIHAAVQLLLTELKPDRKTTIVDVGANPINEAAYSNLLKMGGCHIVGFEPQTDAFEALQKTKSNNETYYPFAVGDGGTLELKIYKSSGMTSIFSPYKPSMKLIGRKRLAAVIDSVSFDTVALDSATDLPAFDMLKIDIQGGENLVFKGAERVLAKCIAVIVELRYLRLYVGEPMMGGVDAELRRQGFSLHKFMFNKSRTVANSQSARLNSKLMQDQLVDGDGVYLRNIAEPEMLSDQQLMHMAIMASSVFESHSLTIHCLDLLKDRGVVTDSLAERYVDALPAKLKL
jgi:FkbM family methyltransferase